MDYNCLFLHRYVNTNRLTGRYILINNKSVFGQMWTMGHAINTQSLVRNNTGTKHFFR